jgi:hypothetical protein
MGMGITGFQWATLILGVLGFLITWTGLAIGWGRLIENIKHDTTQKVAAASADHADNLAALRVELMALHKDHADNVGEVGLSLRQKIADVEKEMHEIEIWGRDNYAVKDDMREIMKDIKAMRAEIKTDFKELNAKIDAKH